MKKINLFLAGTLMCIGFIAPSFANECQDHNGPGYNLIRVRYVNGSISCLYRNDQNQRSRISMGGGHQRPGNTGLWLDMVPYDDQYRYCESHDTIDAPIAGSSCPFVLTEDVKQG